MDDSASRPHFQADVLSLTTSSSFSKLRGFFVRSSSKGSSVRSPTSPLDLILPSNLSNPFNRKSPRTSKSGHKKQWDSCKVGLGLVKLLFEETQQSGEVVKSPKRKNVIFGSQIKIGDSKRSISLPKNYVISLPSQSASPKGLISKSSSVSGAEEDLMALEDSSLSSLTRIPSFGSKACLPAYMSASTSSLPVIMSRSLKKNHSLDDKKPKSVPIPILPSQREIELSEDYTCIISYGPSPKTTHIFGDCILEPSLVS
ncbi:FCS-Like Zinc finger 10 [Linum grandiflorum]